MRLYTCVEACYPCPRCNDLGIRRDYAGEPWGWVDEGEHICPQCVYDSTKPRGLSVLARHTAEQASTLDLNDDNEPTA